MTSIELLAKVARQYKRGIITAEEYVSKLTNSFAGDSELDPIDAAIVVGLIPKETINLVKRQVEIALAPTYMRRAFAMGGRTRTKEEEEADALRETASEKAWAAALKPLLL